MMESNYPQFAERGDSYIVTDGKPEGFFATITPNYGFFEVEVFKEEYDYVSDDDIGEIYGNAVYVERSEELRLETHELTAEDVQKALEGFDIKLPDDLVEKLSGWERMCREILAEEMAMARAEAGDFDGQLTTEEVEIIYGTDERPRLLGSLPTSQ